MNITLKPELAKFVKQQVKDGRYESTDDVMAAAVTRLMHEESFDFDFGPGELKALVEESERDLAAGRFFTWEEVRRELSKDLKKPAKKRKRVVRSR